MIHVPREQLDETGRPILPNQAWFDTAERLTDEALTEREDHIVTDHYRHDQVRAALERLFRAKCAYCEASYTDLVWNVEHFRPKGAVAERPDHPGYYWLAYAWENLYLVCVPCNQKRKDPPTWTEPTPGLAQGKHDQFPVEDEIDRAMGPEDDLDCETRLLLDPCSDAPELFLSYSSKGEILATNANAFAHATIRVCHLYRRRLRESRHKKIEAMREDLQLLETARRHGSDPRVIAACQRQIADQCGPASQFAGVARAVLADPGRYGVVIDEALLRQTQRRVSSLR